MPNRDDVTDRPALQGIEAALHDACTRAMQPIFPLPTMLRLYRNVVGLTRAAMRARLDLGLPPGLNDGVLGLLEAVCQSIGHHFPDRDMPVQDAMLLHEAATKLAAVAHRARVGRPMGRLPALVAAMPMPIEPPLVESPPAEPPPIECHPAEAPVANPPPVQPPDNDDPWADNPNSAWRKDNKDERDRRAHEKLRTVLEERIIKPGWDEGRRLRREKQARPKTGATR